VVKHLPSKHEANPSSKLEFKPQYHQINKSEDMAQAIESLHIKCKALTSNTSTAKNKLKKKFKHKSFKFPQVKFYSSGNAERLSVSPSLSLVVLIILSSAECFPAFYFCENLPPKKQMVPKEQG
jgi:hypothetical protein